MIAHVFVLCMLILAAAAPARAQEGAPQTQALLAAIEANPRDAALHAQLSQAYAAAQNPAAARAAIERALALQPADADYLRAAAVISSWLGDYRAARGYYERLHRARPDDPEVWLSLGYVLAWMGDTDEAASALRTYLDLRPGSDEASLQLARVESWRGNDGEALHLLDDLRRRSGDSPERTLARARALAAAGRPREAEALVVPLLAEQPGDYDLTLAHAIALGMDGQVRAARQALEDAERLGGATTQTRDTARFVRTLIGSSVGPQASVYTDSDRLETRRAAVTGAAMLATGTRVSAGYEHVDLFAPAAGGLGRANGQPARRDAGWGGVEHPFGTVTLGGRLGTSSALGSELAEYGAHVGLKRDRITLQAAADRGAFVVSPRTMEAGLNAATYSAQADWSPSVGIHLVAATVLEHISDGNTRWHVTVSPRRSLVRREHFNADVGVSASRLQASRDLPNGYYDPRRYESYVATVYPYWKASENVGLGAMLALGVQREHPSPFEAGGHLSIEATFGIYRTWVLKAASNVTTNRRLDSGAYSGLGVAVTLMRRF